MVWTKCYLSKWYGENDIGQNDMEKKQKLLAQILIPLRLNLYQQPKVKNK